MWYTSYPLLMLRKLRGPGAGTRADAPREERGKKRREPPCLLSEDTSLNDATSVGTGIRSSQVGREGWQRRRNTRTKRCRTDHYDTNEKTKGQKEAAPASLRFSPSALLDVEDERAAVEATQSVVSAMLTERGPHSPAHTPAHWRVTVEHCGLPGRVTHWIHKRGAAALLCVGDDLATLHDVTLSLEESVVLNRKLRHELDDRMGDFRVDEKVGLGTSRARVLREALLELESERVVATDVYTVSRRLPRKGDRVGGHLVSRVVALLVIAEGETEPRHVPVEELRKLPTRGNGFPPLAFINAVFEPRQGHVNVRLCGGHRVTLVQREPLQSPVAPGWDGLWHQLRSGQLGFWHGTTMGSEEAHAEEDQALGSDVPALTYSLPLGDLQLHCPRGLALPPPPGHPVRRGPEMRAMPSCCTEKPARLTGVAGHGPISAPSAWAAHGVVSDGRLGAGGHGAQAQAALFSVAYLDHFDGTTYEDAGKHDDAICTGTGALLSFGDTLSGARPGQES